MTTIVTRTGKGSPLTWQEADNNFTNLNTYKLETTNNLSDLTNVITAKTNLGLGNVDNTSDVNKPVSTATQTALNSKQDTLPTQTGNAGKFLSTNGTAMSWQTVDALPSQTGNAGKLLTTNGTVASWTTAGTGDVTLTGTQTLTNKTLVDPKLKNAQLGNSATATQNFTLTAEAADGTMKLARGNVGATTQDIITINSGGKVTFPLGISTGRLKTFTQTGLAVLTKYTLTHNLGTRDIVFNGYLECTTADLGYAIGDKVPIHLSTGAPDNYGISYYIDTDNTLVFFVRGSGFGVLNKSTFISATITLSSWRAVVFVRPLED